MNSYEISANGTIFGIYEGETEQEARDACARDAGYQSEEEMSARLEAPSDLEATQV